MTRTFLFLDPRLWFPGGVEESGPVHLLHWTLELITLAIVVECQYFVDGVRYVT